VNDAFETPADSPAQAPKGRAKPDLKTVGPTPAPAPESGPAPAPAPAVAKPPPIDERILIRRFVLVKEGDEKPTPNVVAEGAEFTDGTCVLRWRSILPSTSIYSHIKAVDAIHGDGGKVRIAFVE
jgi:hypothetical protein